MGNKNKAEVVPAQDWATQDVEERTKTNELNENDMEKKFKETRPFLPCVTEEQIVAFDASRPETATGEALVDAVLSAFCEHGAMSAHDMSKYLELPAEKLSTALEVLTGHKFSDFHDIWLRHQIERLKSQHPTWSTDEIARHLGFRDRSALWRVFHRDVRKKEYAALKAYFKSHHTL